MNAKMVAVCLMACLATACDHEPAAVVIETPPNDGIVDLGTALEGRWDRVCFLAPYATNRMAREVTGMRVDVQARSRITSSDRIALAITLAADEVVGLYEIPLRPANFTPMARECVAREAAIFVLPPSGRPHVVLQSAN